MGCSDLRKGELVSTGRTSRGLSSKVFGGALVLFVAVTSHAGSGAKDRTAAAGHTPPETWSKDSMFDVRWGMGPADVKAKHPRLSKVRKIAIFHSALVTERVEGRLTNLVFSFYQGRLVRFVLMLVGPQDTVRQDVAKEEQWYFDLRSEAWGERVRDILKAKYGEPLPTYPHTDRPALPDASSWWWRTAETIVSFNSGDRPFLMYEDAARSEEIKAVERTYKRAREAAKDEESRRRF